jgi:glycosyltransferase involved in cell wall biosynthesis
MKNRLKLLMQLPVNPLRKRLAVVGHPLAAAENRAAFTEWSTFEVSLIVPKVWKARSLGATYTYAEIGIGLPAVKGAPKLYSRPVLASGYNSFFLWIGLGHLLRQIKPEIIYCWEEPWCLSTWQVSQIARNLGVPLVFYSAENRYKHLPWPFTWLQSQAFRFFASCIVPTQEVSSRILEAGYTGTVQVIPLWVKLGRQLHSDSGTRRLGYVGRLISLKRVHLIVQSLCLLPGFQLRIIGDGPERANLEALAGNLGVADRIEFYGHIQNSDLEKSLEGVTLLVLPTAENSRQAEQFGKAALEGIACGLPVLASRTGNLATLSQSLPTLVALDLDTAEQMAEAVTGIWKNFPSQENLNLARDRVGKRYGAVAVGQILEDAFSTLLTGVKPS